MRVKRKLAPVLPAAVAAALIMAGCGGDGETSAAADGTAGADASGLVDGDLDAVCEAGKSEGAVRFFGNPDPSWSTLMEPFTSEYDINVELVPVEEITTRLVAEEQAGQPFSADVFDGDYLVNLAVENETYVENVDWTRYGVPEQALSGPDGGLGLREYRTPTGIGFNPDKYSADELPDTYEEWIDPKWQGQVSIDPRGKYMSLLAVENGMGLEAAIDWYDRFFETVNPIPIEGSTSPLQAVASGQNDITMNAAPQNIQPLVDEGASLEFKAMGNVGAIDTFMYLVKDSPNANAAVCFMTWFVGPGGQEAYLDAQYKANQDIPPGVPEDATILTLETTEDVEAVQAFNEHISESFAD